MTILPGISSVVVAGDENDVPAYHRPVGTLGDDFAGVPSLGDAATEAGVYLTPYVVKTTKQKTRYMQRPTERTSQEQLSQRFGLTPSEAQVVLLLAAGETAKSIAALRNSTVQTVRTQIKRAMQKMDVHRQLDVVRIIMGLESGR